MAKNITWLGASYSAVPAVTLPQTGGGVARFDDVSITTATAADVVSGKVFLASDGTITTGTNSGGGGASDPLGFTKTVSFSSLTTSAQTLVTQAELVAAGLIPSTSTSLANAWSDYLVEIVIAGNTQTTKQILWSWASSAPIYYNGTTGYYKQGRYHNTSTTSATAIQSTALATASTNGYLYISTSGVQFRANSTYGLYGSYIVRIFASGKK